jgi:hypothetical protein
MSIIKGGKAPFKNIINYVLNRLDYMAIRTYGAAAMDI